MNNVLTFPFKVKPFDHQLRAFLLSRDEEKFALFCEMGTGKTKIVIDTTAYLYDKGEINALFVLANKGSYRNWVRTEVPIHMASHIDYYMTYWDAGADPGLRNTYDYLMTPMDKLKIFVMNIEALSYDRGIRMAKRFVDTHKVLMCIDESTTIKNRSAIRTKNAIAIGKRVIYKRIMTGMPITKNPMDLFSQCNFLGPELLGYASFYSFQAHYADLKDQTVGFGKNMRRYKMVTGFKHLDELQDVVKEFSFRIRKDECLDLPPKLYQMVEVELTDNQQKVYNDLVKKSIAEIEGIGTISAAEALTKLVRLHQVVCGTIVTDDGDEIALEDNRLPALMSLLEETDGKVIIWATYRRDIRRIAKAIEKEYGEESVATYFGDTSSDAREEARLQFNESDSNLRFLVANPAVGGFGTTLLDKSESESQIVIYYSNSYNLEFRMQSEDRSHRIGQTKNVTYIDLVSPNTVDEKIIDSLRNKRSISAIVMGDPLSLFKGWLT